MKRKKRENYLYILSGTLCVKNMRFVCDVDFLSTPVSEDQKEVILEQNETLERRIRRKGREKMCQREAIF